MLHIPGCYKRAKIGVCRNYDSILIECPCQYFFIFCRMHSIHPDMNGVMASR